MVCERPNLAARCVKGRRVTDLPATTKRSPLLPDRHEADFFLCDIFDAAPKGDMASMEHPIFSMSTKPDRNARRYENGKTFVEIQPSHQGLATVHDRDILIFCISQLISAINAGREVSSTVRFTARDLLVATNRQTSGGGYARLKSALERLAGTRIQTNITTGDTEVLDGFGLIEQYRIVRESRDGRMLDMEIKLSGWVFNAIRSKEVLTLSRDYFRLRKPLERRMYEIARKHCGAKQEWKIGLPKLKLKCGSNSSDKEFKRLVANIAEEDAKHGHMPDYSVEIVKDMVTFRSRGSVPTSVSDIFEGHLPSSAYEMAREVAPGWDARYLEQEWRRWCGAEKITPKNAIGHFLSFAGSWFEKRGAP